MKLIPALALALLAACAGQSPSPSASTVASTEASPSATPEATASPEPSASPTEGAILDGFEYTAILRIEADNLAVRAAPFTTSPLATASRDGREVGEVRLNAGDFVSVDLGPLQLGDVTWYRVYPSDDGVLHVSAFSWDTKGDGYNPIEPGWIAVAEGDAEHVSLFAPAVEQDEFEGLPLLISGSGDYESPEFEGFDLYLLSWAQTIDDQDAPCNLEIDLALADGSESVPVDVVSLIGAFQEGVSPIGAGDRNPILGDDFEPLVLDVRSACEWTIRLEAQPHD